MHEREIQARPERIFSMGGNLARENNPFGHDEQKDPMHPDADLKGRMTADFERLYTDAKRLANKQASTRKNKNKAARKARKQNRR